jgi:hypothetical protein
MESTKRPNTMTDYIASLNAPIAVPEVPAADFEDANLFATTDFFNFDFAEAAATGEAQDGGNSKFQSWNGSSDSPDYLSSGMSAVVCILAMQNVTYG